MNTASQPLVTVVTPVYNCADYLAECIESILAQTYQNWTYAIVDNCSTDGSLEIALRYAAKEPRIRVHQNREFLRALPNHNRALRQISPAAKYCKVVFSDDWIFPECLERMVAVAEEHPSVGIVGAYALQGREIKWTGLPYPSRRVCGREACREHFLNEVHVFGSATSVLYRADLVRNRDPFYNESNIHSDTEVCFSLLNSCDFGFVHQVLTFTRVRPKSLSTISTDLQSYLPSGLEHLLTHGANYLSREELAVCMDRHLSDYYRFLAKSVFLRRGQEFWEFHEGQLNKLGLGLSRTRLLREILPSLFEAASNPGQTIGKLLMIRRKRLGNHASPGELESEAWAQSDAAARKVVQ